MRHLQPWEALHPTARHASTRCLLQLAGRLAWPRRRAGQNKGPRDLSERCQLQAAGESRLPNGHDGPRSVRRKRPRTSGLRGEKVIPPTYKPKKKFMQLAIAEAKRARDRGELSFYRCGHHASYWETRIRWRRRYVGVPGRGAPDPGVICAAAIPASLSSRPNIAIAIAARLIDFDISKTLLAFTSAPYDAGNRPVTELAQYDSGRDYIQDSLSCL